jgi:hypothetical protein
VSTRSLAAPAICSEYVRVPNCSRNLVDGLWSSASLSHQMLAKCCKVGLCVRLPNHQSSPRNLVDGIRCYHVLGCLGQLGNLGYDGGTSNMASDSLMMMLLRRSNRGSLRPKNLPLLPMQDRRGHKRQCHPILQYRELVFPFT